LSVCVEVCSAAFYLDNDPGVLVSACIFADGAGAAVLSTTPNPGARRIEWKATSALTNPAERDTLRFEQRDGMLRNILTPPVPALAAQHAEIVLKHVLSSEGISHAEIGTWILHAGGGKVLAALQETLGLTAADVYWSSSVLREFGNVSSAFVYFALQAALRHDAPAGWWWMSSFGAGFSCHGAMLRVA
jgi:predicted naringenin-chalcone synthase